MCRNSIPEQHDLVPAIHLFEADLDGLGERSGYILAHVVGAYRELAVASVDENEELNGTGSPEIDQGIECGSNSAPGKQDVVDEDYVTAGDAAGYGRAMCHWQAERGMFRSSR